MVSKHIKTGNRVEISYIRDGAERQKWVTVVEAVIDRERVIVLMPMSGGELVRLPAGGRFEARFYTDLNILLYECEVVGNGNIEGTYFTTLKLLTEGERIQLRNYYRFFGTLDFKFSVLKEITSFDEEPTMYNGVAVDLSGGGMRFVSPKRLAPNTDIHAVLPLSEEYIMALGQILDRVKAVNADRQFQYRVKFLALPDVDREKIVRHINEQQYKALRFQ